MHTQQLYIKNMVCLRCKNVVNQILQKLDLQVINLELGKAEILSDKILPLENIHLQLQKEGFELIFDKDKILSEQIKLHLLDYLHQLPDHPIKLSQYLADKTNMPYVHLSKVFSWQENTTIEKHFILLKIEKVKELVSYNQLTISQIADYLTYSSVQALSNQFKNITGLTVSEFKEKENKNRKSLDALS